MNDYQRQLYELMLNLPMKDELKDTLYAAILSTPITTSHEFTTAKDIIMRILLDLHSGTLTVRSTLRAVFNGAYDKAIIRPKLEQPPAPIQTQLRPVPFYNWLEIRA